MQKFRKETTNFFTGLYSNMSESVFNPIYSIHNKYFGKFYIFNICFSVLPDSAYDGLFDFWRPKPAPSTDVPADYQELFDRHPEIMAEWYPPLPPIVKENESLPLIDLLNSPITETQRPISKYEVIKIDFTTL